MSQPRVALVVNGGPDSAMGVRAAAFRSRLSGQFGFYPVFRLGRGARSLARMAREVFCVRPDVCYVLDLAGAGVIAAAGRRHTCGTPFVLDMGDAVVELGRVLGRGAVGMAATHTMSAYAMRAAAAIVVRGSYHRELLRGQGIRAEFIPDGVDVAQFAGHSSATAAHVLTLGVVGSSVWVESRQTCYGWDLVEVVAQLRDHLAVRGVLIGDGSGIAVLKRLAEKLRVSDAIDFVGRVPYAELPARLHDIDICLSTQTNDVIGNVRTTGKLPLYLAAGRFVLASRVGEAARVLPPYMLVPFEGKADPAYSAALAARVVDLVARGTDFRYRPESVALARQHFEYDVLAPRVASVLEKVLACRS